MSRPLLLLFDGHGLAFRAFYALPEMRNSRSEPVHAILGFANMVLRFLEDYKPAFAAVSFDRGRPAFRLESFADYKGQREHAPEGLSWSFPWIEQVVEALRLPIYSMVGWEADDCIGTMARRAENDGLDVAIMSGDLDMLQLVTDHVKVLAALRKVAEPVSYDLAAVRERYGIEPLRVPDYKALAGDSSDNIPGVAGIGKDSASQLLQAFGSIEGLIERAGEVPAKWQKKLAGQDAVMRRYRDLATISREVPLEVHWEDCRWQGYDAERLLELCDRLEFPSLRQRLGLGRAAAVPMAVPSVERPRLQVREVTWTELDAVLPSDRWIALWTRRGDDGLWDTAFGHGEEALTVSGTVDNLLAVCRGRRIAVPHLKPLLRHGVADRWAPGEVEVFDFALASYLLHAGLTTHTLEAALRRMGLESLLPVDEPGDAVAAMMTALPQFEKGLSEAGQSEVMGTLEVRLAWPLAAMEEVGILVDKVYLESLGQTLDGRIQALTNEIHGLAGVEFNLNSPKQVGDVLFERLKLPGAKKTKTGYATGVEVLTEMAPLYPIVALLLQYREVAKLKSTYVDTLPTQMDAGGRVHTTFNQTVAATGRLSSSDPNLQNIPIRSELGKHVRRAFIAPPGHVLLAADYSQIELRILAHVSQDPALLNAFRRGEDVHTATASEVFGLSPADVTPDIRRRAKEINFGIMYGMSGHGLSQRLGIPRKEAQTFIERYLEHFAGVRDYLQASVRQAEAQGWVATLQGRRRVIPDINSRNQTVKKGAERMAVNAPIQGTAADFIKRAMLDVYQAIVERRLPGRLLLQVHDELLLEVPEEQVARAADLVRPLMEGVFLLSVPLQVDVSWGHNWAEQHDVPDLVGISGGPARD